MKALTYHGPRRVRLEEAAPPCLREPTDALVAVALAGVCGSDLHVYEGREVGLDQGTVLGHEFVGEVVEAGAEVRGVKKGTLVLCPFSTSCGTCFYCERGLTSRCIRGELFGWVERGKGLHGAQCEKVRVPLADSTLLPIPGDLTPIQALLCGDVLATGYFGAETAGIGPGTVAAVVGCGPVGLLAARAALHLGASAVYAVDSIGERLELAERLGAHALELGQDPIGIVRQATDGRGADAAIEAVGSAEATRLALDLVRHGGAIAAVGVHTESTFAFSPGEAYDRNLTYHAGRCPVRAYLPRVLDWVRGESVDLASIVSHRLPLAEGVEAYALFAERREGCIKVVLEP